MTFQPLDTSNFQVADIELSFAESNEEPAVRSYRRELNIDQALHRIQYRKDGVNYQREYFASNPANVQVFRLSADQQGAYTGFVSLKDAHGSVVKAAENKLTFSGTLAGTYKGPKDNYAIQLQYEAQVLVMHEGGSIEAVDGKIAFKDCDSLIIIMNGSGLLSQSSVRPRKRHSVSEAGRIARKTASLAERPSNGTSATGPGSCRISGIIMRIRWTETTSRLGRIPCSKISVSSGKIH